MVPENFIPGIEAQVSSSTGKVKQKVQMRRGPDGVEALTPEGKWEKVLPPQVLREFDKALKSGDRKKVRDFLLQYDNYWLKQRVREEFPGGAQIVDEVEKERGGAVKEEKTS